MNAEEKFWDTYLALGGPIAVNAIGAVVPALDQWEAVNWVIERLYVPLTRYKVSVPSFPKELEPLREWMREKERQGQ